MLSSSSRPANRCRRAASDQGWYITGEVTCTSTSRNTPSAGLSSRFIQAFGQSALWKEASDLGTVAAAFHLRLILTSVSGSGIRVCVHVCVCVSAQDDAYLTLALSNGRNIQQATIVRSRMATKSGTLNYLGFFFPFFFFQDFGKRSLSGRTLLTGLPLGGMASSTLKSHNPLFLTAFSKVTHIVNNAVHKIRRFTTAADYMLDLTNFSPASRLKIVQVKPADNVYRPETCSP